MKKKKTVPQGGTASTSSSQPVQPSPAATQPKPQATTATTNGFKAFILLVAAVISLLIFFGIEPNKLWLNQRILPYWEDYKEQKLNLDLEERKLARYQTDYLFDKNGTGFFEKRGNANKVFLLLPPTDSFAANGLKINDPEPAVC